jgi:hypothetical protein
MGCKEGSALLDRSPRLRDPLAYVFGRRYLRRSDEKNARMFFEAALRDAAGNPADLELLDRLTRTELRKLGPP